jgi:hypothetical protein
LQTPADLSFKAFVVPAFRRFLIIRAMPCLVVPANSRANSDDSDDEEEEEEAYSDCLDKAVLALCGYQMNATIKLIGFCILGAVIGVVMNQAELQANNPGWIVWIGFPGDIFIRFLKGLVIPMIFCNMIVGIADIAELGNLGKIGSRTFLLYMATTCLAAVEGLFITIFFKQFFSDGSDPTKVVAGVDTSNGFGEFGECASCVCPAV